MGYLGTPFRLAYQSKNFTSGLTNVMAVVIKPNGVMVGPFLMPELASPFLGRYAYNLMTATTDPAGEWLAMIVSPTEGIQDTLRVPLYPDPAAAIESAVDDIESAAATITTAATNIENTATDLSSVTASLMAQVVSINNSITALQTVADEISDNSAEIAAMIPLLQNVADGINALILTQTVVGVVHSDYGIETKTSTDPIITGYVIEEAEKAIGSIGLSDLGASVQTDENIESTGQTSSSFDVLGQVDSDGVIDV